MKRLIALVFGLLTLASCGAPAGQQAQDKQLVARQQGQYQNVQPAPFFDKSLERQEMIELYRARNNAVSTFSYVQNQYNGKIMFQCPSIGYPLPYSIQITNPDTTASGGGGSSYWGVPLPQAEPNGLYPPPTANGTWIMCLNDDGTVSPSYHEPLVTAFPYPMKEVNGELVRADSSSNIRIDVSQFTKGGAGKDANVTTSPTASSQPTRSTTLPSPKTS